MSCKAEDFDGCDRFIYCEPDEERIPANSRRAEAAKVQSRDALADELADLEAEALPDGFVDQDWDGLS